MRVIWRFLKLLKPFTGWVLLSILLTTATIASGIGLLGTSAYLISRAALHPSIAELQVAIVGVRFFGISRGIFRYLERLITHSVNFHLLAQLRGWIYELIEPLIPFRTPEFASGDLLHRVVSDVETLENFYVRVVSPYIAACITVVGMGFFVGSFDIGLGLALVSGLLVCGVVIPLAAYWIGQIPGRTFISARVQWSAKFVESVQGIGDLTAFDRIEDTVLGLDELNGRLRKAQIRQVWGSAWVNSTGNFITNLTVAVLVWLAIPLVSAGKLEGFLLPVVTLLALASFEAVNPLAQAAHTFAGTQKAGTRLLELAEMPLPVREPAAPLSLGAQRHEVQGRGLSFTYEKAEPVVLSNVDLNLVEGRKIALVGPSGAGKSTISNLILRLWDFEQGEILLDGEDIRKFRADDVRSLFTVISQFSYMFSASLRHNLRLARPNTLDHELLRAINLAGLEAWFNTLPDGLNTWIGEHGLRLSGGERQRLAIARTLLRSTPFIILDEPTTNLDAVTEALLIERLLSMFADRGMLWITHRLVGMERMDEIIVLDEGKIVERGIHSTLIKTGGLYARLWELQNRMLPLISSSQSSL